jgi:hypothetical protein
MNFTKLASVVLAAAALCSFAAPAVADDTKTSLEVKRLVFARGIDGHEPQDAATAFSAKEDRVYAFVELANPGADDNVDVVFTPPAGTSFSVPLKVSGKAKHFRTWAFTRRAHEAGEWSVVVRAPGGKALARQSFTVTK